MILSDFLSRQEIDKSDLHEFIPISFDMKAILNEKYYKVEEEGKYLVQNVITSKRERNKSARSAWNKEGSRSKFETRMVSEKISKTNQKILELRKGRQILQNKETK